MGNEVNFSRNIYIILIFVLVLGVIIQISHSQFALKFQQNGNLLEKREELYASLPSTKISSVSSRNYCIAYDSSDQYSISLKQNAEKALDYMQKTIVTINLSFQELDWSRCETLIVASKELNQMGSPQQIEEYIINGGFIFFMSSFDIDSNFQILYRKFGISSYAEEKNTQGLQLMTNVLIGENKLKIDSDFLINSSLSIELEKSEMVLAKSMDEVPLMWRKEYGYGAMMFFNGSLLQEKINRGLFTGALSLLEPDFIYPIFNSKIFFIDDFPAPIPTEDISVLREEYNRNTPSFFQDIWWPDMLQAAKSYGLKYTGVIIETYNNRVLPPFSNPVDENRHNLIAYGREIIKSGGEIGIHGYNHQSLVTDRAISSQFEYESWGNTEHMTKAIKEVLRYTQDAFPNYSILSYVPPSNVLSDEGRKALINAWPTLTVISSLYGEDATGTAYVQEFEIAKDGVIEMPRITSGYSDDPYDRWAEANTITSLGVFSHFIHPDDVINEERSKGQTWDELYRSFENKLVRLKTTYPWLRPMTSTEGAIDMAEVLTSQVTWLTNERRIIGKISNYKNNSSYIFRTTKKIGKLNNCDVKMIDVNTFLVTAYESSFEIELGGE